MVSSLVLDSELNKRVLGQEHAVDKLVPYFFKYEAGLNLPGRPPLIMLMSGPTGSGKTFMVEALADVLFGASDRYLRVDCGEYQHSHDIAKIIGSPPGYLGHRETIPYLSQENLNRHCVANSRLNLLLLDEIEKASDALFKLLLGILDKATLTLGSNTKVDFSNTMIFMTSNLGVQELAQTLSKYGYESPSTKKSFQDIEKITEASIKKKFTPEFLNRIDIQVCFKELGQDSFKQILKIQVDRFNDTLRALKGCQLVYTNAALQFLLDRGISKEYGARELKRVFDRYVVTPVATLFVKNKMSDYMTVSTHGEELAIKPRTVKKDAA